MREITKKRLFRSKKYVSLHHLDNQLPTDKASFWPSHIFLSKLLLFEDHYGNLRMLFRNKGGQLIIDQQVSKDGANKQIHRCKDTCRGFHFTIMSPDGSLSFKVGILFDTRIEACEFDQLLTFLTQKE